MASQTTGQETGVTYELTNAAGYSAVFNDPADSDYVGGLGGDDAITGLDSPEVRESFADLVEADGAIHNTFYHGRRPITLQGQIQSSDSSTRNVRMTRLQRAVNSLSGDGTLAWTPSGSIKQFVRVRKQQPTRFTGSGTVKNFFVSLVAADPRIYADSISTHSTIARATNETIENRGSAPAPFETITISRPTSGSMDGFVVRVGGAAGPIVVQLDFAASWTSASSITSYVINPRLKTVVTTGAVTNAYSDVNFLTTTWADIPQGSTSVRYDATVGTPTANMAVTFRDAWI
jgi:hypothetical protein